MVVFGADETVLNKGIWVSIPILNNLDQRANTKYDITSASRAYCLLLENPYSPHVLLILSR